MRINVEVDPAAYARQIGALHTHNEVLKFIMDVDAAVADFDFSRELIYQLGEEYTHNSEGYRGKSILIGHKPNAGTSVSVPLADLAEDLSDLDEEHLIVLMADAIFRKREREEGKEQECEHSHCDCASLREDRPLPKVEWPGCKRCGCARQNHNVRVGEDRTGCENHTGCDEFKEQA